MPSILNSHDGISGYVPLSRRTLAPGPVTIEAEGLPPGVSPHDYFAFDIVYVGGDYSLQLPERLVHQTETTRTYWDSDGALRKDSRTAHGWTSQWLDYSIKTREDWARLSTLWRAELDERMAQLKKLRDTLNDWKVGNVLVQKEFEVLLHLARYAGQVVKRESLLNAVWGDDVLVVDRTIDVHIRKIREKLGRYADYIETIKGVGYRLREQS